MKIVTHRQPHPNQPKLLVFINNDALGDSIMKLPFLDSVRKRYPAHHITLLSNQYSPFAGSLAALCVAHVDQVISEINFEYSLKSCLRNPFKKIKALQSRFDVIIDAQFRWKNTWIVRKIPHQTFISGAVGFWLSSIKPEYQHQHAMHATLRCCELINLRQKTPITPEKKPLKIPEAFNEVANKLLPDGPCYIGFAPGAGHPTRPKKWPIENFLKLAVMQVKLGRTPVFFLGPDEHHWITMINASVPEALMPEITNPHSTNGPLMAIALAKRCHAAVSNDSGTGHLIAASHIPIVTLFGPTRAEKFAPWTPNGITISAQKWQSNNMQAIPIKFVADTIENALSRKVPSKRRTDAQNA